MEGKKVEDKECLSPAEEVPSKTVILVFLWGTKWMQTYTKHKFPRSSKIPG